MPFEQGAAGVGGNVRKATVAKIVVQQRPILVANIGLQAIYFGISVTAHPQQVRPCIIVEIEKRASPADEIGTRR